MKNIELLNQMLEAGYLEVQRHPEHNLYIYNYSPKVQYERVWNEVTLACRGLILNENYEIVARPFAKFFNLGEQENQVLPNEPFEVFEKMDGSLGILYWIDDKPFVASRGSFASEQSDKANELLYSKYKHALDKLEKGKTYLFEIIYPQNRIVVDYGDMEELVLLAIIDNETGLDLPLETIGFPIVKKYHGIKDIMTLKELEEANKEGFVVKFASGLRYKIKFEEYLRLHRLVTQVSTISIWEYMKENQSFDEILDRVPDEFYDWVKKTVDELNTAFKEIENQCLKDFKVLESRKETALYFMTCKYPSVLFSMLDKNNYAPIIWKMIRPEFQKAFALNIYE
jgi:RNA ligase